MKALSEVVVEVDTDAGDCQNIKAITSVGRPKIKRDAGVKAVFLLRKKTAFTPASLFIFGRRTNVTLLDHL